MEQSDAQVITDAYYKTIGQIVETQEGGGAGEDEGEAGPSQTSEAGKEDKVRAFEQLFVRPLLGPAMPGSPLQTQESTQDTTPTPTPRPKQVTFPGLNELGGGYNFQADVFKDPSGGTLSNFSLSENTTPLVEDARADQAVKTPPPESECADEESLTRARKRTRVEDPETEHSAPRRMVALGHAQKGKQVARPQSPGMGLISENAPSTKRLFTEKQTRSLIAIAISNYVKEAGERAADAEKLERVVTNTMELGRAVAQAEAASPTVDQARLQQPVKRAETTSAAAREQWMGHEANFKRAKPTPKVSGRSFGNPNAPHPPRNDVEMLPSAAHQPRNAASRPASAAHQPSNTLSVPPSALWARHDAPEPEQQPMDVDRTARHPHGQPDYDDAPRAVPNWAELARMEPTCPPAEVSQQPLTQDSVDSQMYYSEPTMEQGLLCKGHGGGCYDNAVLKLSSLQPTGYK
ncbi:hypothetical protein C8Q79DRAFT_1009855 [Trametes meyenii]|nr:hypothetical protein C8Q79DRAFT_1009855 [Trametes meyenii]